MTDREKVIIDRFDAEKELVWTDDDQFTMGYNNGLEAGKNLALELLKQQECKSCGIVFDYGYKAGKEAVVRCKDCKHRPKKPDWETYEDGADIEFPDGKCPCQCSSDRYYSWYPDDDWYCAEGERAET